MQFAKLFAILPFFAVAALAEGDTKSPFQLPDDMNCTINIDNVSYGVSCKAPLASMGKGKLSMVHAAKVDNIEEFKLGPKEDVCIGMLSAAGHCYGISW